MNLTTASREFHELSATLEAHERAAKAEGERLRSEIAKRAAVLNLAEDGIDHEKVALARTVIYATDYSRGGSDRDGCVRDAIKQLSTGKPVREHYGDLWRVFFGTKNYGGWRGQRCDCEYGYGPRHGSICFEIGITSEARKRGQASLTPEEVEAAIYFLINLERIQGSEMKARVA